MQCDGYRGKYPHVSEMRQYFNIWRKIIQGIPRFSALGLVEAHSKADQERIKRRRMHGEKSLEL